MNIEEIIQDPHVKDFLNSRPIRDSTKKQYIFRLKAFSNFVKDKRVEDWKNEGIILSDKITFLSIPSYLIEEAEIEEDKRIRQKNRKIKKYFNEYISYLTEQNHTNNHIKAYVTSVKTFYREFEIEVPPIRIGNTSEKKLITSKDVVGKDDILKVLEHCNIKYKAIILLMSSSGMGRSEVINLKYKDFLNAIADYFKPHENEQFNIYLIAEKLGENINDIIGTWQIRRFKTNMEYITFNSPESTQSIIYYLLYRFKENKPIVSLDDPLFEARGNKMSFPGFLEYFSRLNDKCDFGYVGTHRFFTSHKLRKYFASTLNSNNVPQLTIDWFLGHSIAAVTDAYFKPDIDSLKEQYKRVVEELSIEKVITREITTKEYDILIKELSKERETRLMEKKEKDKELQSIKEGHERLEQRFIETMPVLEFFKDDEETQKRFRKWKKAQE